MTTDTKNLQPKFAVLLWAATAAVIVVFYLSASSNRVSSEISVWSNGIETVNTTQKVDLINSPADQGVNITHKLSPDLNQVVSNTTPAQDVRITQTIDSPNDQIVTTTTAHQNDTSTTKIDPLPTINEDLHSLLRRAAMDDKTVILTEVNEAWAAPDSLLDAFLESFRIGEGIADLLNHVIMVAMDAKAFERCQLVHPHCYMLKVDGLNLSSEKGFGSKDFLELVWTKVKLQQSILQLGYNFLFTDLDVMWFRNPFQLIEPSTDFMLSCDVYFGNPELVWNYPNTGFIYMKSNKKTVKVIKYWNKARRRYPALNEQNVFNKIKHDLVAKIPIKMQFVDTKYFGGFCNYGKDLSQIRTMHSNCCVGLANKLHDLHMILDDWKNYTSLPEREKQGFTWRIPGVCIH